MTLRRIFSDQRLQPDAEVSLGDDAASHMLRVLRLRRGDSLVVFDGSGTDFEAEITAVSREAVTVRVGRGHEVRSESPLEITLLQGVCRGPRMDTVVQKATELGVTRIRPVLTSRGVVRFDSEQAGRKRHHWQRVAIAAAEQSGRSRIPEVGEPQPFEDSVATAAGIATRLMLDPAGPGIRELGTPVSPVGLLIGPEGGLTPEERQFADSHGFTAVRLGPRILRTETAPLAALALLQFLAGDF
jgi:16S rRNA (uracil1498-N3)-methyltransferase